MQQRDFIAERELASAYLAAAETALRDPFHTPTEREKRAEFYRQQAAELETVNG